MDKANLSDTELQERFLAAGPDFFNKDEAKATATALVANDAAPQQGTPLDDFRTRYKALRLFLQDMAIPRLKEVFHVRANAAVGRDYPHCKTLDGYLLEYRTGIYDNKKRAMVDVLCNQMWGKECFGVIEKVVMDKLKIRYKDILVNGQKTKTRRSAGNYKKMINRLRQTLISDRFR